MQTETYPEKHILNQLSIDIERLKDLSKKYGSAASILGIALNYFIISLLIPLHHSTYDVRQVVETPSQNHLLTCDRVLHKQYVTCGGSGSSETTMQRYMLRNF
jgi:hypothetical protein